MYIAVLVFAHALSLCLVHVRVGVLYNMGGPTGTGLIMLTSCDYVDTVIGGASAGRSRTVLQLRAQLHSPLSCPSTALLLLILALSS